jgi:8-oxo-dGTP pyrophosphatase MutT (NUDIX family)
MTPGGGREPGEPPAQAAARELSEETGLALELVPAESESAASQPGIDLAVFTADAPIVLSDEHDAYEWVGVDGLSRCLPDWVQHAYREVLQQLEG